MDGAGTAWSAWEDRAVLPTDGALERCYRECRQQLFTCALAIARCPERAEDAIQEAFCRLFRLDARPRDLKPYVFRAVRNAALDQLQGRRVSDELADEFIFDPRPGPCETAADAEFRRRAAAALLSLSADERETIVQHLYAGLKFREIAEIRDVPLGTITAWYQRGLKRLRVRLGDDYEGLRGPTQATATAGAVRRLGPAGPVPET